jgi:hypothetical protein
VHSAALGNGFKTKGHRTQRSFVNGVIVLLTDPGEQGSWKDTASIA